MRIIYTSLLSILIFHFGQSQMVVDGDSLVGNEWINLDQEYYKFQVYEDGMYRIAATELAAAGIDLSSVEGVDFQLYRMGNQVPIYTSSDGIMGEEDYISFYGEKNHGELESVHYPSEEDMLNPSYSIINDTISYFLTWDKGSNGLRYTNIENDLSGNLPAPLTHFLHSEKINFHSWHYKPHERGQDFVKYSDLVTGEGFGTPLRNTNTIEISADNVNESVNEAYFRVRFGVNSTSHDINLEFNGKRYQNYTLSGQYKVFDDTFEIPTSEIKNNNVISLSGQNGGGDRNTVAEAELIYPRTFDFNNQSTFHFSLDNNGTRNYIEVRNFDSGTNPVLYDLRNRTRKLVTVEEDIVKINIEASDTDNELYLIKSESSEIIQSITNLQKVEWIDYASQDHDFVIISSEKLFTDPDNSGANWVQEYADYRSTAQGGDFNPIIVSVENLYDQFGYGINRHFIALNNFANYVKKAWPSLEYFFVIGKGIEYPDYRTIEQQQDPNTANYYVPAWGAPGSDNLLFSEKGSNYPIRPVGRIAATNPYEVKIYLDKVKAQERNFDLPQTIDDKYWTKNILHLSGGGRSGEQNLIASHLKRMEDVISVEKFGADVTTFRKNSADPLQTATSQRILDAIDNGLSLITFFGHSAVGTFDFSIEDPSKYNNSARLPMILSLGCYSGNIHVPSRTKGLSEEFVLEPENGAVAFAASSGVAYISSQAVLGNNYYSNLTESLYGQSIGHTLRATYISLSNRSSISYTTLLQQFTYHGDPAIRFVTHAGPDYLVDYSSIRNEPEVISSADESYTIFMDVVNIGSGVQDSITIAVEHILPDGSVADTLYKRIKSPASKTTVSIEFTNQGTESFGENRIRVMIDSDDEVEEAPSSTAEANNTLDNGRGGNEYAFFISDNSAKPIYPREFGIATDAEVTLKASTTNLFSPVQNYILQIDTSALFTNPLEETIINSGGGLIEWKPEINMVENTVYYWRITPEQENPVVGRIWEESSFIYLPGSSEGWNQSHYYQYLENDEVNYRIGRNGNLQMPFNPVSIRLRSKVYSNEIRPLTEINLENWRALSPFFGNANTLNIFAWTPTGLFENKTGRDYGSLPWDINVTFPFDVSKIEGRREIKDLLADIPDSSFVAVFLYFRSPDTDFNVDEWETDSLDYGTNLFKVFEEYGANKIRGLKNGTVPYLFSFIKGGDIIDEQIGDGPFDFLTSIRNYNRISWTGNITSKTIGPAKKWNKLLWQESKKEIQDSSKIEIYLKRNVNEDQGELYKSLENQYELDLSQIDANIYPYIELKYLSTDIANRTSPILEYLQVLFDRYPDIIFSDYQETFFYNDSLFQGENIKFSSQVVSNLDLSVDSLQVKYSITNTKNQTQNFIINYHITDEEIPLTIDFETTTKDLSGLHQFKVELNPNFDQKEEIFFNNIGIKSFNVLEDNSNPLLDVTFDGQHIMDGDIISSQPEIIISLKDENEYLLIDDPSYIELKLQLNEDNNNPVTIPYDSPDIEFIPSSPSENEAKIIYRPSFEDGKYTLYVQGRDASNNFSGDNEIAITFQVINKKSISNVFNYPNPFSTATQFVFTLTGEIPQDMFIQIMTLSGKVVKEIRKEELGPLKVGNNRTEYWWDGTDQFGDKLGNGVYLYRVVTKNADGSNYDQYDIEATQSDPDSFFKEGFGKMVIIR